MYRGKVLAACSSFALGPIIRALGGDFRILHGSSLAEAQDQLDRSPDFAVVVCGVYFQGSDGSAGLQLLRFVRASHPRIPFITCRLLDGMHDAEVLRKIVEERAREGASAFVDWPGLHKQLGSPAAEERFAAIVRGCLHP